jgi:hypothetical protein
MKANLAGLTPGQLELWDELSATPQEFALYGGVALVIRFNHRHSSDFDFFSPRMFDPQDLLDHVGYLRESKVVQLAPNTLTCLVERAEPVKLSFFGVPLLKRVQEPELEESTGLHVASLMDIAVTKVSTVQKRAAARDYLDLSVLLRQGGLALASVLQAAAQVYGSSFNPHITLKALSYFQDGDLGTLSSEVKRHLQEEVRNVRLDEIQ